ncbi:MAG TPA: neutral zinc metallopeptidase [Gemmatimonadaceae bacterium]|nr:neutral zinc metallopeptidase [Gemmatimonadaceae bacterium]
MRWTPGGRSSNLEDRRSGGGMGRGLGIGGTVVVLALSLLFGRNLFTDLGVDPGMGGGGSAMTAADSAAEEPAIQFMSFLLDDVQNTWAEKLPRYGTPYRPARLAIFRNSTNSGCGPAQAAMGPFYCPLDERVYLDLGFYDELRKKLGAPGQVERGKVSGTSDFAHAYVLAHELGHHVQHVLGTDARVRQGQESNPAQANELSVRLELQADCYAGVWANSTSQRGMLEPGDVEEALGAAAAVGDDRIQQRATGQVNVDSFTHGSAAQRTEWFKRGMESGDPRSCSTL